MTTEQHLELLTKAVLNLTHLTAELADTLTDIHLGVLSPNESLGEDLHKSLDMAKSNALLLNDLLNPNIR
jgi:hypothetical protein